MASDARPHNRWPLLLTLRATAGGKTKGQGEIPKDGVDGLGLGHLNTLPGPSPFVLLLADWPVISHSHVENC